MTAYIAASPIGSVGDRSIDVPDAIKTLSPVLAGKRISLAPLTPDHAAELADCTEVEAFEHSITIPATWDAAGYRTWIEDLLALPNWISYVALDNETGRIVARSSYIDISADHRTVEVGSTWIAPASRGTHVNPEMKLLMLSHAFESWAAMRVQLKCDVRNEPSRRALRKLGAFEEGVMRNHVVLHDGSVRDSLFFSILDTEWPTVRERLIERLAGA